MGRPRSEEQLFQTLSFAFHSKNVDGKPRCDPQLQKRNKSSRRRKVGTFGLSEDPGDQQTVKDGISRSTAGGKDHISQNRGHVIAPAELGKLLQRHEQTPRKDDKDPRHSRTVQWFSDAEKSGHSRYQQHRQCPYHGVGKRNIRTSVGLKQPDDCGYFCPTPRFGTPDDFRYFVDTMHAHNLGVFLDWVPAHFPKDAYGLYEFDGKPLYEYQGYDRMENRGWGTRCFDVGREEVQSFLISSAAYWAREFHADGLRVDAVTSMLYLDYDREPGEWLPNVHGTNRNLEAIAFFKKLNAHMRQEYPGVLMIAEESTAFPHVTGKDREGLGFHLKWNMGWMNDTLFYAEKDPLYRSFHHDKLTFSLMYAFNEHFVLPISHDEVVHGKKSLIDKMPGDYWKKFAGARLFAAYQMLHPGKKLSFMGNEIGQFREWDYAGQIEWFLTDEYATHRKHKAFIKALNAFYLDEPALWQVDDSFDGFKWIDANDKSRSITSFRRIDKNGRELIAVLNFTPVVYEDFLLEVPADGTYCEVFNTDDTAFGGSGVTNTGTQFRSEQMGTKHAVRLRLPPLGVSVLRCTRKRAQRKKSRA